MGKMNVAQFAGELGLPVGLLLEQLQAAGVAKKQAGDRIVHAVPAARDGQTGREDPGRQQAPDAVDQVHRHRADGIVDPQALKPAGGHA